MICKFKPTPSRSERAALFGGVLLFSLAFGCGERTERISPAPGIAYPRTLQGEKSHRFLFHADAGELLHLVVDQRGVDVVVLLQDPSRRLLYEVDTPGGKKGEEKVVVVTPTAGDYSLIIQPFAPGAKGDYALKIQELRPAQKTDRLWAAAETSFACAERRWSSGRLEPATVAYRAALPFLKALGDPRSARIEWRLGQALAQAGELRKATALLESAVSGFRGSGDGPGEALALKDLGTVRRKLGETGRALSAHQRALFLHRQAGDVQGTATSLNDLGRVLEAQGDLEGAISHFEQALVLWHRLGAKSERAATLQNLGNLYALLGHDEEAHALLTQALDLAGESSPRQRSTILVSLGWAEYLAGRPEQALGRYQEALRLAEISGDRMAEAGIWDRRGSALRALHRYREAALSYQQALDRSRSAGRKLDEGNTLANLGWLDLETGDVERARERLTQAVELLASLGDPNGEVYGRIGLSRAERRLGALGPAREEAEAAVRLVERMRAALRGPVSRGQFLATRFDAYEELVSLLMDLDRREPEKGHARRALEVAERARARNLLEEMTGVEKGESASRDDPQSRSLLAEIHRLEKRRRILADQNLMDPQLRHLDAELRTRWLELDRLTSSTGARPFIPPLAAEEIQSLADEHTLLIVYLLAEPASFAWTVDRHSVVAHVLPGRERIEKLARRTAAGLSQSPEIAAQGTVATALRELSDAVIAPLQSRLEGRRCLAVLADGALHLVPFAALPTPEPLLVRHEIVMIPSATVLLGQRRRLAGRPLAPGWVAVLADPVFSLEDERLSGNRPGPASSETVGRSAPYPGPLQRLPFTADEARVIAGLVPREKALMALGPAASRELVTGGALRRYRILHFATHGFLDPVLPERSGIVLSQFDERGHPRPGFLSAPNVAALALPAELAVLSGCETGLGREVRGEGLVGLTQAFFRAGTRRVVVSLWKVRDRGTAELMDLFYRNLLTKHLSPAAALRAAQLSLQSREPRRSPYFWAGFSLQGDWR
jgi:CHAT domain-containing protein/Tfp pilus assembly protein PilF